MNEFKTEQKLALFGGTPILTEPLQEQHHIGNEEIEEAIKVIKTGKLSCFVARPCDEFYGGPWVRKLEQGFIDYFKTKYAISVNSATSGLFAAVYALSIGPGDEVIVPPYTMSATAAAILACSAVPVFVDIDPENYCIDAQKLESAITDKTKAIMVVHLFGNAADMNPIMAIAKKYNLKVIEDCAQSPGALYKGNYTGTIGDIGIYSFNRHKTIQTGEGGVIVTNDDDIALKLQLIRNHAEVVIDQMDRGEDLNFIGWNYRMTEIEAAIGLIQINRLDSLNAQRIEFGDYLYEQLQGIKWLIPNQPKPDSRSVYYRFPMRYIKKDLGISRKLFVDAMNKEGYVLNAGYVKPLYLQSIYKKREGNFPYLQSMYKSKREYKRGLCPVVEKLYDEEFIFCSMPHLAHNKRDIDLFVQAIKKVEMNVQELKKFENSSA